MQNICARKFRSATVTLLLSEDQCPMMMHIFANHSKYFCKQNLYSFVSEKYLLNRCKSIFVRKSGSATVILLLSEDQCPPKHLMYTCADNDAVWIFISWPCIPFLLSLHQRFLFLKMLLLKFWNYLHLILMFMDACLNVNFAYHTID